MAASKSGLGRSVASFDTMLNKFGVVTVMDAYVFNNIPNLMKKAGVDIRSMKINDIMRYFIFEDINFDNSTTDTTKIKNYGVLNRYLTKLDTLKISNINIEGPDKTVTGGRFNDTLLKFGKKARIEMQDALGNAKALEVFGGAVLENFKVNKEADENTTDEAGQIIEYGKKGYDGKGNSSVLHFTENFVGPKTIVGTSFFVDQKTGRQIPVKIVLFNVMPDSIFNLSQDAEGNATVFDMNADLGAQIITIGTDNKSANDIQSGVFYSIVSDYDITDHTEMRKIVINSNGKYVVEKKVLNKPSSLTPLSA